MENGAIAETATESPESAANQQTPKRKYRGRGRPFPKGISPNPTGRPKHPDISQISSATHMLEIVRKRHYKQWEKIVRAIEKRALQGEPSAARAFYGLIMKPCSSENGRKTAADGNPKPSESLADQWTERLGTKQTAREDTFSSTANSSIDLAAKDGESHADRDADRAPDAGGSPVKPLLEEA